MHTDAESLGPLLVAHLLGPLDDQLVALLDALDDPQWEAPTIAGTWTVKDVAAHLLDSQVRKLALCRDGRELPVAQHDPARDLVGFVNRLNADGVRFFRELPPATLVPLIAASARASARYHLALDPMAPAAFAVSWAGESASANWFDTARELTERWHHQQQIRLAVGRPGAMSAEFHHPVLACFMRALPHWYRDIAAPVGSRLDVTVEGDGGGTWHLWREPGGWRLVTTPIGMRRAHATIPADIAWRVFTRGIARADAMARSRVAGDQVVGAHVLQMTAIVG